MSTPPSTASDPFILGKLFPKPLEYVLTLPPSVSDLSKDCLFVFDANVLISLYKLGQKTVADIEAILKKLSNDSRLYIPERALQEFVKNRGNAVKEAFEVVCTSSSKNEDVAPFCFPMLEGRKEYQELLEAMKDVKTARTRYKKALSSLRTALSDWGWNDAVSQMLARIISPSHVVATTLSDKEVLEDTLRRHTNALPPGYKDKSKPDLGVGDVLIWHTMLELALAQSKSIVFVSNEEKPDWVINSHDTPIMARPELYGEFFAKTGRHFGISLFSRFIELMHAEQATVDAVAAAERRNAGFWRGKISEVLDAIRTIVTGYLVDVDEVGSGYDMIRDNDLYVLLADFHRYRREFEDTGGDADGRSILSRIEAVLIEITSLNKRLEYIEARMKESGDTESNHLREKCSEYGRLYDLWSRHSTP